MWRSKSKHKRKDFISINSLKELEGINQLKSKSIMGKINQSGCKEIFKVRKKHSPVNLSTGNQSMKSCIKSILDLNFDSLNDCSLIFSKDENEKITKRK